MIREYEVLERGITYPLKSLGSIIADLNDPAPIKHFSTYFLARCDSKEHEDLVAEMQLNEKKPAAKRHPTESL